MPLIQLIYISTATQELEDKEIHQILESSVRHNTPQEVTGLLLYSKGSFMQVLEGAEAAVDETMGRIEKDPLHHSILTISRTKIACRDFGQWAMAFRGVTAPNATKWPAYAPFFDHGFDAMRISATPGLALGILRQFAVTT